MSRYLQHPGRAVRRQHLDAVPGHPQRVLAGAAGQLQHALSRPDLLPQELPDALAQQSPEKGGGKGAVVTGGQRVKGGSVNHGLPALRRPLAGRPAAPAAAGLPLFPLAARQGHAEPAAPGVEL